jgi:hypothetical protein
MRPTLEPAIETSVPAGDPRATHRVVTSDVVGGFGIYGSYACELDAWRVRRDLMRRGSSTARVEPAVYSFLDSFLVDDRLIC